MQHKRKRVNIKKAEARKFYLYISPWIIGFVVFMLYPMFYSFALSFTNSDISGHGDFVGLGNYVRAFSQDTLFFKSLFNTFFYSFISVPLCLVFAFFIALILNQKIKGIGFFRTCFFIPYITSGLAVTILWGWMFNPQFGLINYALAIFGIEGPGWLTDAAWSKPALIIMSMWSVGNSIIIFLAGLQDIPRDTIESAKMDGAGFFRILFKIQIPLVTSTIFFNLLMGIIFSLQMFMPAYVLTSGGPNDSTYMYMLHLYNSTFRYYEMGYGSTLAWIIFVIILTITLVINKTSKRWVYYNND